ncbi:MAG TPA: DAK2 domain-containing protein [Mycobacteriales bacterium]|nr:DAK2 domain-containing protein [Mycobacteriales bacterium]
MTGQPVATLDAATFRSWCRRSADALGVACARIDALNVFPVADGDTGTNMLHTMLAAAAAADRARAAGDQLAQVAQAAAAGSLPAARGSSGVILSRFLHGVAAGFGTADPADGAAVQAALSAGADAAYAAVSDPVEGTILSVARAAAKAARDADPADLTSVARAAVAGAREELARTTDQVPALAAAGVVDAGGQGLLLLFEALADTVSGVSSVPSPEVASVPEPSAVATSSAFTYEVQYLLDAPAAVVPMLRQRLAVLGDAVAVVSGAGVHNVHAHVDDVGAAIEAGVEVGRPHDITVTRFADRPVAGRVIALCPRGGLADLFRSGGATVVEVGDDANAITADLTAAVCAPGAHAVVLLPNSRALRHVADAAASAARSAGCAATVVPTRSPVQGIAALAIHDPGRRADDDTIAMSAAAAATRYAEVAWATYDALTSAGPCRAGDVLGLIDDDVAAIGDDIVRVSHELVDRLLTGGGELVTIVIGEGAPASLGADLADYVIATRPAVETSVLECGQPNHPLMLGVE